MKFIPSITFPDSLIFLSVRHFYIYCVYFQTSVLDDTVFHVKDSDKNMDDVNGITLSFTPPSPTLGKSKNDISCACGRDRSSTRNSDNSYDNHSLEAEESQNLIGSASQNQTVVTVTVHSEPTANESGKEQTSVSEAAPSSPEGTSEEEKAVEENKESATDPSKDLKKNSGSRPKLQRMESTTEHAQKYMERESDEDIVPVSSENPPDIYSMSVKDVQETIHRKSTKARGRNPQVHFSGIEKVSEATSDSLELEDNSNVEFKGFHKLESENRSSFREDKKVLSDSVISSQVVHSPVNNDTHLESAPENSDQAKGTKRESWAVRKLRRSLSHGHERNNNINVNTEEHTDESGPHSPSALNRWKLVLNVQKFQSAVKQQQQERVSFPKEKKPVTPKISKLVSIGHTV
jgi:hypothetical protein